MPCRPVFQNCAKINYLFIPFPQVFWSTLKYIVGRIGPHKSEKWLFTVELSVEVTVLQHPGFLTTGGISYLNLDKPMVLWALPQAFVEPGWPCSCCISVASETHNLPLHPFNECDFTFYSE